MWRTERGQGYLQFVLGDPDVAGGGKEFVQQGSSFLVGTGIVRPQEGQQVAFGLVGHHFDEVGQVFALGGEFDHGVRTEIADCEALGNLAAFVEELGQPSTCRAQLLADVS